MYISSYPVGAGGFWTSTKPIIFSWSKNFKSFISLTILLASIKSSNALGTFFIATFALIEWSSAEHTTPYTPWPIYLIYSYFSYTTNYVPAQLNDVIPFGTLVFIYF